MNELIKNAPLGARASGISAMDRFLRRQLLATLAAIDHGSLVVRDALGTEVLGKAPSPIHIDIADLRFYRLLATHGSVGAAEAFIEGYWRCDDLVGLIRLLVRNRDLLDGMETSLARWGGMAMRAWHALRENTRDGSRRNIAAHYDLGNDFFSLFLSDDLMYSSALWTEETDTLGMASVRKLDVICQKLGLRPGMRVVEIGTGWGGFAVHAASRYGCHVTTTTISAEQFQLASERVANAGLQDRVTLLQQDYRDLQGSFDRLVSIEMIEAIGASYMETYFAKVGDLLTPEGQALIQAITIEDHRYEQALRSVDFIKRYVFPSSFIPSVNAMLAAKTQASDLALVHLEDFGLSYARTLNAWRQRFLARLDDVRHQGFDDRFIRLWEFYLAYCEGGFLECSIGVSHLLLAKPQARPMAGRWTA
ncbi:MAG: Tuberculostearic acid methyltransferase UfaA1 [Luteibacter sp.]|uniref:SAM-dependent methyltransferase n=1 Tax=Luteibacter sp. TaxID=1886636 RepID=UPI00137F5B7D|nr:cyclopropane-fatty-acyl-phospholipid synthase family protein [Luteibacter sp.]KAF1008910.1 MAG: Tuberculostearic acid methyltransferase UfaA1 [Luteibacter sp.]